MQLAIVALTAFVAVVAATARDTEPCLLGVCPTGYTCRSEDKHCVGIGGKELEIIGECVNTMCPKTYTCMENVCIRPPQKRLAGAESIGPCVNQKCPDDHVCEKTEDKCYPRDPSVSIDKFF